MLVLPTFCKIVVARQVFGRMGSIVFSCLSIENAYSNFTYCGAYMLSFLACYIISAKRAHPSVLICHTEMFTLVLVRDSYQDPWFPIARVSFPMWPLVPCSVIKKQSPMSLVDEWSGDQDCLFISDIFTEAARERNGKCPPIFETE